MEKTNKKDHNQKTKLSIQVSLNGLSFCALDPSGKRITFFKNIRFSKKMNPIEVLQQIEKLYEQEPFLQLRDPEVKLLYSNELYSLVPKSLFHEEAASDYLKFNTKILETDFVAQDKLEEFDIVNVFVPYTNINNYFFDKYGEFEYRHTISILTEEFLKADKEKEEGTRLYLNKHFSGYDLVIIRKGQLLLANSFQCNTPEDFIYYLLFTAEQLDLDPQSFELILLGDIDKESDYFRIAYTYVKEISFLDTSFGYIYDVSENPPRGYKYYSLFKTLQ